MGYNPPLAASDKTLPQLVLPQIWFHLLMNVREALEKVVKRCHRFLRTQTLAAPLSAAPTPENEAYASCRLRLLPHLEGTGRGGGKKLSLRLDLSSARQASWMPLRPEGLEDEEKRTVELLRHLSPDVGRAQELALGFVEVVKERRVEGLRRWLIDAGRSGVTEFRSFANGITSECI